MGCSSSRCRRARAESDDEEPSAQASFASDDLGVQPSACAAGIAVGGKEEAAPAPQPVAPPACAKEECAALKDASPPRARLDARLVPELRSPSPPARPVASRGSPSACSSASPPRRPPASAPAPALAAAADAALAPPAPPAPPAGVLGGEEEEATGCTAKRAKACTPGPSPAPPTGPGTAGAAAAAAPSAVAPVGAAAAGCTAAGPAPERKARQSSRPPVGRREGGEQAGGTQKAEGKRSEALEPTLGGGHHAKECEEKACTGQHAESCEEGCGAAATGARRRSDTAPPPKRRLRKKGAAGGSSDAVGAEEEEAAVENAPEGPGAEWRGGEDAVAGEVAGEPWPAFLARVAPLVAAAGGAPAALFEIFRTTDDLGQAYASFAQLFHLAARAAAGGEVPPWAGPSTTSPGPKWQFPYEPVRVLLGGSWKAKQLWDKLDCRSARSEYADAPCGGGRLAGRRVVIVGAGPSGLRAAIELRLLGARVTVLEKRKEFSRINQLHLWNWCGDEIKALGARCLEPPSKDFGANPDLLHIGIAELQTLLFKTALLLGVEVLLGAEFVRVEQEDATGSWCVHLGYAATGPTGARAHVPDAEGEREQETLHCGLDCEGPSPGPPSILHSVAVLVGTDGLGCRVGKALNMGAMEMGSLRAEDAIGLVCNFAPLPSGAQERKLRSFALARQFYGQRFKELEAASGAELENVVYTKSKLSHYFVMTPTRKCLLSSGVIRDASYKPILGDDNVDAAALDSFVRRVVSFKFKADAPTLQEAAAEGSNDAEGNAGLRYADRGPQLFDFSKLRRAAEGISFLEADSDLVKGRAGAPHTPLLVALAGDALLEPFWPEGLGIVRGFMSALDVSSAVALWAGGASQEEARQHFATAFTQLKSLGAQTRGSVLRPEEKAYGLAPSSRYRGLSAAA